MKKSSLNIKSVGIIAIFVILLAEYMVFPWLEWVDETRTSIDALQVKLNKQVRLIEKGKILAKQNKLLTTDFSSQVQELAIIKKNQDSAIVWLKEVDSQLAKYQLVVNKKAPLREIEINDNFAVFVGKINVKGDYSQVLSLLGKLENYKAGNRVRQLRLNSNAATRDTVVADVEFFKVFKRS